MAWSQTKNRKSYFYRSVKRKGRVSRVYFGSGAVGQLAAESHARERFARRVREAGPLLFKLADAPLQTLDDAGRLALHGALLQAGYYRQCMGYWRVRRV